MKKGLNKVLLIGYLESQPEVRESPNGRRIATFTLTTSRSWISAQGEQHEETEWFSIVAWDGLAEICSSHLTHDQAVYVEGRLQTRSWQDDQGRTHFRTEVVAQDIIALDTIH
ncbi:MAG: single-stranded DNA-binding protein [Candidatus Promineifilaceae bacterium]|nr:single-stranded DNA-binding protein [Candidatus Promineifilaceae bacterium]